MAALNLSNHQLPDLSAQNRKATQPVVIAHRGASGYLPEHTLPSVAMAHAQGAEFIEQDIVLTQDNHSIVLHDIHLDAVTDVAKKFPDRKREDGRFYAIDFSLAEVKTLCVHERIDHQTKKPVFAKRFPAGRNIRLQVPTLAEQIELIQGLNQSTGKNVGIYVELKNPQWHHANQKDVAKVVLKQLETYGYQDKQDMAYVQCFDLEETRRIRNQLKSKLKLVQLMGNDPLWNEFHEQFDAKKRIDALEQVATFADGIGPAISLIMDPKSESGKPPKQSKLIKLAHEQGLAVHAYTFRADSLPVYAKSLKQLTSQFIDAGVDGMFSDFPDRSIRARQEYQAAR